MRSRRRQLQAVLVGVALGLCLVTATHGLIALSVSIAALILACAWFLLDNPNEP